MFIYNADQNSTGLDTLDNLTIAAGDLFILGDVSDSGRAKAITLTNLSTKLFTSPTINSPTLVTPVLGVATATSINGVTITSTTATLALANSFITVGNFSVTLTSTATTSLTLPNSGTLATLAGVEELSNKSLYTSTGSGNYVASAFVAINSSITASGTAGVNSASTYARVIMNGGTALTIGANANYAHFVMGTGAGVTEASSGTHALIANMAIRPLVITNGSAATTNTASLYIEGAPSGVTPTNEAYAAWFVGKTRLDFGSDATGDIYYRTSSGSMARLAIGSSGNVLTVSGGLPAWGSSSGSGDMVLASAQTVTGAKTFNASTFYDKGNHVFDVRAYGTFGTATATTSAINAAIVAANAAGGGVVWIPQGSYSINTAIALLAGVYIRGAGMKATTITQTGSNQDGMHLTSAVESDMEITISDFTLVGTGAGTGKGIYISGAPLDYVTIKNVNVQSFGAEGIYLSGPIVSVLEKVVATQNHTDGIWIDGTSSVATSVTMISCYGNANTTNGIRLTKTTYAHLSGCAADSNAVGYYLYDVVGCTLSGCGAEMNTTAGFKVTGVDWGSEGVNFIGCFNYGTPTYGFHITGVSTQVNIMGCRVEPSTGTADLQVDAGCQVNDINNSFVNATVAKQRVFTANTGNVIGNADNNIKLGDDTRRGTTESTNSLVLFNGTAPVGTLTNGVTLYSASGELRVMDSGGTSTLLSPHDDENYWVFDSMDTITGNKLHIDVEKLLRFVNDHFGLDFIKGNMIRNVNA